MENVKNFDEIEFAEIGLNELGIKACAAYHITMNYVSALGE
jgi:hypothetical protein